MTSSPAPRYLDLDDGAMLRLYDARGTTLRVTRGRLWLTQHCDRRDIVLQAGDAWTIERNGLTLANAQQASSVALAGPGPRRFVVKLAPGGWLERLAAWLERLDAARIGKRWVPYV